MSAGRFRKGILHEDRDAKLRHWPFLALGFFLRSGAK